MKIKVLDHGYVEFIEGWGLGKDGQDAWVERDGGEPYVEIDNDFEVGIVEAARQSTQGSFRGWKPKACTCKVGSNEGVGSELQFHEDTCEYKNNPGDRRLIAHLFHNNHATPFEFAGMVIEVQCPIFGFREWHRHRTQSYNEMSARYAPLPGLDYLPTLERLLQQSQIHTNKQAAPMQGADTLTESSARQWREMLDEHYANSQKLYALGLELGIPKELARLALTVGRYSKMRASANLRNWLGFIALRADPMAQWEIQQYAFAVGQIIKEKFPQTYSLLPPSRRLFIEQGLEKQHE